MIGLKKAAALFSALLLALGLCGCGVQTRGEGPYVLCSSFPSYDFARRIAGGRAEVEMLLSPGMESHSYEPTPGDIVKIRECDVFICVGGESESWLDKVSESVSGGKTETVRMMDLVSLLDEEHVEGMETDAEEEGGEEEYDEHVWTSPVNAKKISRGICSALCRAFPEYASEFEDNYAGLASELDGLDRELRETVASAKRDTVIFADRFPFRYLFREYGIKYYAAFPGCSGMTEAGASTVAFLISKVKELGIPCVFITELSAGTIAETVADSCGVEVFTLHSCHNVTAEEFAAGETYISLMKKNIENLRFALG